MLSLKNFGAFSAPLPQKLRPEAQNERHSLRHFFNVYAVDEKTRVHASSQTSWQIDRLLNVYSDFPKTAEFIRRRDARLGTEVLLGAVFSGADEPLVAPFVKPGVACGLTALFKGIRKSPEEFEGGFITIKPTVAHHQRPVAGFFASPLTLRGLPDELAMRLLGPRS